MPDASTPVGAWTASAAAVAVVPIAGAAPQEPSSNIHSLIASVSSSSLSELKQATQTPRPEWTSDISSEMLQQQGSLISAMVSYSRKDSDFVKRLVKALEARDLSVWVDWASIPPSEDWLRHIRHGIETAQCFVVVLSPDFCSSEVCMLEVDHAVALGKRIVPIVRRDVPYDGVRKDLSSINWIFCRDGQDDFGSCLDLVECSLRKNVALLSFHTHILNKALEWQAHSHSDEFLLPRPYLLRAEPWLALGRSIDPAPTPLQVNFVTSSRLRINEQDRTARQMDELLAIQRQNTTYDEAASLVQPQFVPSFRLPLQRVLTSRGFTNALIALILVDFLVTLAELILSVNTSPTSTQNSTLWPSSTRSQAFFIWSLSCGALFAVEILARFLVLLQRSFRNWGLLLDTAIVSTDLVLILIGFTSEASALIIALRMWRVAKLFRAARIRFQAKIKRLSHQNKAAQAQNHRLAQLLAAANDECRERDRRIKAMSDRAFTRQRTTTRLVRQDGLLLNDSG